MTDQAPFTDLSRTSTGPPLCTLNLPWPPATGNHQHVRAGKRVISCPRVKAWRDEVAFLVRCQAERLGTQVGLPTGPPYKAYVEFFMPRDRRRHADLDNLAKVTLDALTHAGWIPDDSPRYLPVITLAAVFMVGTRLSEDWIVSAEEGHEIDEGLVQVTMQSWTRQG